MATNPLVGFIKQHTEERRTEEKEGKELSGFDTELMEKNLPYFMSSLGTLCWYFFRLSLDFSRLLSFSLYLPFSHSLSLTLSRHTPSSCLCLFFSLSLRACALAPSRAAIVISVAGRTCSTESGGSGEKGKNARCPI